MKTEDKNFDGLDQSQLGDTLIGMPEAFKPKLDLVVSGEDSEIIFPEDLADVFQMAVKNILHASNQLKTFPSEGIKEGGDIFLDLAVTAQQAETGGYLPLEYQRFIVCSQCEDRTRSDLCPKCEGDGRVMAQRRVEIKVPKNVESDSVLRVAKEGHAPRGDLFVKIVIREEV